LTDSIENFSNGNVQSGSRDDPTSFETGLLMIRVLRYRALLMFFLSSFMALNNPADF
jgi:hypothetical protein